MQKAYYYQNEDGSCWRNGVRVDAIPADAIPERSPAGEVLRWYRFEPVTPMRGFVEDEGIVIRTRPRPAPDVSAPPQPTSSVVE